MVAHSRSLVFFVAMAVVTIIHCLITFDGAHRHFPNVDEVAHLPAGVYYWKFGRTDCYVANPPLVRAIAATSFDDSSPNYHWWLHSSEVGTRPEFHLGADFLRREKLLIRDRYVVPRIVVCFTFSVACCYVLAFLICRYIGSVACLLISTYWLLCPNILANAPTILPDVGAMAVGIFACISFSKYTHRPSVERAAQCGFVYGLALLTKLTWVIGFIVFPLCVLVCTLALKRSLPFRALTKRASDVVMFASTALFVLNAGYLFEEPIPALGSLDFCSELLGGTGCDLSHHGNRFRDSWLGRIPMPFPRSYLQGVDCLRCEVEMKQWSFLDGKWKFGSWPHYYIMTTLYKTPEPTLIGAVIGFGVLLVGIRRTMVKPEVISMFVFLIIPAVFCFASVSLQGGFNHHHRYVLMIYPPMFALAAYIGSPVGVKLLKFRLPFLGPKKRSIAVPLAVTLVVLSAVSSLRVHPYYTSYFNTLSGGPKNGWRLLGFSNIDWGQDILEVDKWLKQKHLERPLVMDLNYFNMNGELFDVATTSPPLLPLGAAIDEVRQSITETQWWIISVKKLYNLPGHSGIQYLQQLEPVDRIAYAYHVYRIDPLSIDESQGQRVSFP